VSAKKLYIEMPDGSVWAGDQIAMNMYLKEALPFYKLAVESGETDLLQAVKEKRILWFYLLSAGLEQVVIPNPDYVNLYAIVSPDKITIQE
jgi:hypothetical protein